MPKLTDEQLKLLHAHLDGETSDAEADEARELLEDAGAREYFDTFLKMRGMVKSHSAIPAPKALKDSVLANIKSEINAEAPIHQLPTASWWAPMIGVAAAILLVLAVTFMPRGESDSPADVAKQSLPTVSDEASADESIEENSRALNEQTPEDITTDGGASAFGQVENDLRETLDLENKKDQDSLDDVVNKLKKGKRESRDSQPKNDSAPETEKAESKQGENSESFHGTGGGSGGRAGQAPAKKANSKARGTDRKNEPGTLGDKAENKELDKERDGGSVEKLREEAKDSDDSAPAESEAEESGKSAPEGLGKGKSDDSKGEGWGPDTGNKRARRKDASKGEDPKAAPKPESNESPNDAVDGDLEAPEADEDVAPPAAEPAAPPEPRQQVDTQVVEIASPAGKGLAAQADLLWVSGLYGQAEIDGDDDSDVEAITVEVSPEQLPKLIAALKALAKEQDYGQITLPEKQQAVDGVVKVVIRIK